MAENIPNDCFIRIQSPTTSIQLPTLQNEEDNGKAFYLFNESNNLVLISTYSTTQYFDGDVSGNSFYLEPYQKAHFHHDNGFHWIVFGYGLTNGLTNKFHFRFHNAGVYALNANDNLNEGITPIFWSCSNLTNVLNQPNITGALTDDDRQDTSNSASGNWINMNANNSINLFVLYKNYGFVAFDDPDYTGIRINFKNRTNYPVIVNAGISNSVSSVKIYYCDREIVKI